jgi:hypothetical protein
VKMNSEQARQTLAQLELRLSEASAKAVEIATERQRISFAANTGDAAARKALDKANAATTTVTLEIENLRSAIEEAKRRLAEAERAEEHARLAVNGDKAREIADRLLERSEKIDRAFAYVRTELDGFRGDLDELHSLGLANPRAEQFKVLGGLALSTALMGLPLKSERDHLAPKARDHKSRRAHIDWAIFAKPAWPARAARPWFADHASNRHRRSVLRIIAAEVDRTP